MRLKIYTRQIDGNITDFKYSSPKCLTVKNFRVYTITSAINFEKLLREAGYYIKREVIKDEEAQYFKYIRIS